MQMHPTFYPTSEIFDVGRNVRCIWELARFIKKKKRRQKSRYTILDYVWSRSNFSSNIFWFIQPDFHVGCICVQFNPTFGFSSLRWVQNICGGVCFKRFYWHSNINDLWRATKNQIKRREDHKQDKREEAKMASKKEKDSNAKNDWTDHEVSLLMWSHSDWKNWKDSKIGKIHLSLNSVESVQASNCIQLDWPHQVFFFFFGVKLDQKFEPVWTQNPSHPFWTSL